MNPDYYGSIDYLLKWIDQHKNVGNLAISDRNKELEKYGVFEVPLILEMAQHLVDDGYIRPKEFANNTGQIYQVTFNGHIFIKSGGYARQQKDIKAGRYRANLLNVIISLGTGLAGLYALGQMMKFLLPYFCHCR